MAKNYEISFKLGAQMAGNFAKTMSSASGALGQLSQNINAIGKEQKSIQQLTKLRTETMQAHRQFNQARDRVKSLADEISKSKNPSKELVAEFEKAKRELGQTKGRLDQKREALRTMNTQLGTASTRTSDLVKRQEQLAKASQNASKAQANLQNAIAARDANTAKRGELRGQLFDAVALGASVVAFTSGYRDMQKAQGELATLGVSNDGLAIITKKAQEMSNQVAGVTVPDFIRASYDIRSGIESISEAAVGEFTKIASMTAAATKSTTGEMTNLFAKGYGIYRKQFGALGADVISGWQDMSAEEKDIAFGEYFSAGISTAVQKFRTDGSQMSQGLSALGASATAAGHSMAEQLAVLGTLQQTMSGSEAATRYKSFLQNAAKAGEQLGLSFVDAEGHMRTTPEILAEIQGKYGETITAIEKQELQKAFGTAEAVAFIDLLIQDVDGLASASASMGAEMQKGAKATESMAQAAQKGREFELLQQRLSNATTAISSGLVPAILPLAEHMGKMAQMVGDAAQKYPMLTKVIGLAVVGLIALKVAAIAGAYAFTFIRGAWLSGVVALRTVQAALALARLRLIGFSAAQVAAAAKMKIITATQWLWNAALTANPIGLIIVAIGAFIAAGVALYKNWDKVTAFFTASWSKMKNLFLSFAPVQWMIGKMSALTTWASNISFSGMFSGGWEAMKNLFLTFHPLGWMMSGFSRLTGFLSNFSLYNSGRAMLSTLANGIKSAVSVPVDAMKGALQKVRNFLPFSDAKVGPLSELTASGQSIMNTLGQGMEQAGAEPITRPLSSSAGGMLNQAGSGLVGGGAGGGSMSFTITQQITLGDNAGSDVYNQAKMGASDGAQDLIKQLESAMNRERRLSYA